MARKVKVDVRKIIGYLNVDFKIALANTVELAVQKGYIKGDKVVNDEYLYLAFKERANRDLDSWEEVPEECVDVPDEK